MIANTAPRLAVEVRNLANHVRQLITKSNDFMQVESRTEMTLLPGGSCSIRVINGTSSYMWFAPTARQGWHIASHLVRWHAWLASDEGRAYILAKRGLLSRRPQYDPTNEGDIPF